MHIRCSSGSEHLRQVGCTAALKKRAYLQKNFENYFKAPKNFMTSYSDSSHLPYKVASILIKKLNLFSALQRLVSSAMRRKKLLSGTASSLDFRSA